VNVEINSGDPLSLIDAWSDSDDVILIDTVVSPSKAGSVHVWENPQSLPVTSEAVSSHGLGLAEAIEVARALGRLPRRLRIYGIEGRNFGFGPNLVHEETPGIADATDRILHEISVGAPVGGDLCKSKM
jgi:hydrogenase maturation protease